MAFALVGLLFIAYAYARQKQVDEALTRGEYAAFGTRAGLVFAALGLLLGVGTIVVILSDPAEPEGAPRPISEHRQGVDGEEGGEHEERIHDRLLLVTRECLLGPAHESNDSLTEHEEEHHRSPHDRARQRHVPNDKGGLANSSDPGSRDRRRRERGEQESLGAADSEQQPREHHREHAQPAESLEQHPPTCVRGAHTLDRPSRANTDGENDQGDCYEQLQYRLNPRVPVIRADCGAADGDEERAGEKLAGQEPGAEREAFSLPVCIAAIVAASPSALKLARSA